MRASSIGDIIKEARKRKGITQKEMANGICSILTLSRVENSNIGISPEIFEELMGKVECENKIIPKYSSFGEFEAFENLYDAYFYIKLGKAKQAKQLLKKIDFGLLLNNDELKKWWIYLSGELYYRFSLKNIKDVAEALKSICDFEKYKKRNYSYIEMKLELLLLEIESNYEKPIESIKRCYELKKSIKKMFIMQYEKEKLMLELKYIYAYIYTKNKTKKAFLLLTEIKKEVIESDNALLIIKVKMLDILYKLSINREKEAKEGLESILHYSEVMNNNFSIYCRKLFFDDNMVEEILEKDIELWESIFFSMQESIPLDIGGVIGELRRIQKITQTELSKGICSIGKISKIENDSQYADALTYISILQKLGISDSNTEFCLKKEEYDFFYLNKYLDECKLNSYSRKNIMKGIAKKVNPTQKLMYQEYLFQTALLEKNKTDRYYKLIECLKVTRKDIELLEIRNTRYTKLEIKIMLYICYYKKYDYLDEACDEFASIIEYIKQDFVNVRLKNEILPLALKLLLQKVKLVDEFKITLILGACKKSMSEMSKLKDVQKISQLYIEVGKDVLSNKMISVVEILLESVTCIME